jgi:hypothetical protein
LTVCCAGFFTLPCLGRLVVLVDQVGYEATAPKHALVMGTAQDHPRTFSLIDTETGKAVLNGSLAPAGQVKGWGDRVFWPADFSSWQKPGHYAVEAKADTGEARSCSFAINSDLLERKTLSNVVYYFKSQRASGLLDRADRHLRLPNGKGFVDLHGGWYDATGDYGIHFSQLNFTSYFNTQQVPLVAWSLLKSYHVLESRKDPNFSEYERRMLAEGLYGADFLVRMKRPHGSFFQDIDAPGIKKLPQDRVIGNPNWRPQIKKHPADSGGHVAADSGPYAYQVSFRSGGGMAIAALALASLMPEHGDFSKSDYLRAAEQAFALLKAHNREVLNDHTENILDDYCALMAATDLYKATHKKIYRKAADHRARSLMAR